MKPFTISNTSFMVALLIVVAVVAKYGYGKT